MGLTEILSIIAVVLLFVIIILQISGRKKSDPDEIITLLKRSAKEQRDDVQDQIAHGTTEQFERFAMIQKSIQGTLSENRRELNQQLHTFGEQVDNRLSSIQRANAENSEKLNATLENKMKSLQDSNEKRLEQIRGVVDEKLQKTLETRLAQSFELVSKQLESVGQGLGEMKALAADAKSLKMHLPM